MDKKIAKFPAGFIEAIEDCVSMLEEEIEQDNSIEVLNEPLSSLMQQCEQLAYEKDLQKPIRIIHNFACTGGTLIAKCIASMPNTLVLSEVEPHSQMTLDRSFSPTDLIQLLRSSSRQPTQELKSKVFAAALSEIVDDCENKGLHLILRDHAHSKYCFTHPSAEIPSLLQTISGQHDILSMVTVRHPLDSYLSVVRNGWVHFSPPTFNEYCLRYLEFLGDHTGTTILKYEDFVNNASRSAREACDVLQLKFCTDFRRTFGIHKLSGDSGRSAFTIAPRIRFPVSVALQEEVEGSIAYRELCAKLDYEGIPSKNAF